MNEELDLTDLTNDGDTVDLPNGRRLTLKIESDPDASINDYDADGRVVWSRRNRDTGHSVRPDDMNGAAMILDRDQGADLWWQPYEGSTLTPEYVSHIRELVEYGFSQVGLILSEEVADSRGSEHRVDVDQAWIGGCDSIYPELVADLWSDLSDRIGA